MVIGMMVSRWYGVRGRGGEVMVMMDHIYLQGVPPFHEVGDGHTQSPDDYPIYWIVDNVNNETL